MEKYEEKEKEKDLIEKILKEANLIREACQGIDGELEEEFPLTVAQYCSCARCSPEPTWRVCRVNLSHEYDDEEWCLFTLKASHGINNGQWLFKIFKTLKIGEDKIVYEQKYHVKGPGRYRDSGNYDAWDEREIEVNKKGIESKVELSSSMWTGTAETYKYYIIENKPSNVWLTYEEVNNKVDELKKKLPKDLYEVLVLIKDSFKKGVNVEYKKPAVKRIKI